MIPILLALAIVFGFIGIAGTIVIGGLLLVQIVLLFATKNRTLIHDAFAYTVVVDKESQKIFNTSEERIKYRVYS